MRVFLNDGLDRLQIVSAFHLRRFHDLATARAYLRPLFDDPVHRVAIRQALVEDRAPAPQLDERDLVDEIAQRLVRQDLVVVSCAPLEITAAASVEAAETTTPLEDEQAAKAERTEEEDHWLEIELVDDEGNPVPGELYTVELPDGSTVSGRLDDQGQARLEGIDPGTAKVSFPDLDKDHYEPE